MTLSTEPILKAEWLKPGAHVNLAGAHQATAREADSAPIAGTAGVLRRKGGGPAAYRLLAGLFGRVEAVQ